MSNKQTDELVDLAIDIVDKKMRENPTIPEEARTQLENETFMDLMEGKQCQ